MLKIKLSEALKRSNLFRAPVFPACYDGEGGEGGEGGESGEGGEGDGGGGDGGGERTLTQAEVNRILAEEKRKFNDKFKKLEESYEARLQDNTLSDDERNALQKQYEDLQARFRTKEQQMAHERKQAEESYKTQLEESMRTAKTWEQRYTESTIQRELQTAAVKHDAYNADQIVTLLRTQTALVDQVDDSGKPTGNIIPMVEMTTVNSDTGKTEKLQMTPDEAVSYMKKNPELWGNLFKNGVREGIGSMGATGSGISGDGKVDHSKLTDEQYFKLRRENPAALGIQTRY